MAVHERVDPNPLSVDHSSETGDLPKVSLRGQSNAWCEPGIQLLKSLAQGGEEQGRLGLDLIGPHPNAFGVAVCAQWSDADLVANEARINSVSPEVPNVRRRRHRATRIQLRMPRLHRLSGWQRPLRGLSEKFREESSTV